MSTNLPPVPHQSEMIDDNGRVLPVWADWFKQIFSRVGGNVAPTNNELLPVTTARINSAAVTADKIAAAVAGNGLSGGAGTPLAVNVDGSTIAISGDTLSVPNGGIPFAKLLGTDWSSSAASSGYLKLPSGLYIQWGITGAVGSAGFASVTFPIAFPNACLQAIAGIRNIPGGSIVNSGHYATTAYSASSFQISNQTSATYTFNWMAIGF